MRALAGFLVKIATGEHVVDRQSDAAVERAAELDRVQRAIDGVVVAVDRRRLLEERIVIVPRPQIFDLYAAVLRQGSVDFSLGRVKRAAGQVVQLVEKF